MPNKEYKDIVMRFLFCNNSSTISFVATVLGLTQQRLNAQELAAIWQPYKPALDRPSSQRGEVPKGPPLQLVSAPQDPRDQASGRATE